MDIVCTRGKNWKMSKTNVNLGVAIEDSGFLKDLDNH